jgi:hypothetical protein
MPPWQGRHRRPHRIYCPAAQRSPPWPPPPSALDLVFRSPAESSMATAAVDRCRFKLASSRRISVPLHGRQPVAANWGGGGLDVGGQGGRSFPLLPPRGWATGAATAEEESG